MISCKVRSIIIALFLASLGTIATARAEIPAGWIVDGSAPKDFEFSRDPNEAWQGSSRR
jgi:hypothetical protein